MKIFKAEGYEAAHCLCGYCGAEFDATCVVVANTRSEALGMLLMQWPESEAKHWELTEVTAETPEIY